MSDTINGYDKKELTKAWLSMSNDNFFRVYGFNWIPPIDLRYKVAEDAYKTGNYNNPFRNDFRG